MIQYLKLIRVNNWVKNGLIALPFIFTPSLWSAANVIQLLVVIVLWGFIASSGYIINDILDLESDRVHAVKRYRPLAAGDITVRSALLLAAVLLVVALAIAYLIHKEILIVVLIYFILNTAYSIRLKTVRFLDILILTSFFMLRIIVGAVLFDINITTWFLVTSFFGFLAVSIKKREMEVINTNEERLVRRGYSKRDETMLSIGSYVSAFASLAFLNLHTILSLQVHSIYILLTVNVLALYLIFSFLDKEHIKEDPIQTFLSKPVLIVTVLAMLILYVYMIYTSLVHT